MLGLVKPAHSDRLADEEEWNERMTETDRFLAWVALQVGCLYVWGAQGQQMTPQLIKKRENSSRNYKRAMAQFIKHAKAGKTLVAYDCSGLVVKYLLDRGLMERDTTAHGLYTRECMDIGKDDLTAGDLVFKKSRTSSRIYHVGVYMGDGTVVHAKGRDDGVVREDFGRAGWNRFGQLKAMGQEKSAAVFTRTLRRTSPMMRGDDVRALQSMLVAKGYDTKGIDGVFGRNTEKAVRAYQKAHGLKTDGIAGQQTWAHLMGA